MSDNEDKITTDPVKRPLRTKAVDPDEQVTPATPRVKVEKIIDGAVIHRKKSLGTKIKELFTGDDARSVVNYVFLDVMIPAAKTMFVDMVTQGSERFVYGESRRSNNSSRRTPYTSYNQYYGNDRNRDRDRDKDRDRDRDRPREISRRGRANHDFREIILESRRDAEEVVAGLVDLINDFGFASVEDLYDMMGITAEFTDVKWGWDSGRGMSVDNVRGGYILNLPSPSPID